MLQSEVRSQEWQLSSLDLTSLYYPTFPFGNLFQAGGSSWGGGGEAGSLGSGGRTMTTQGALARAAAALLRRIDLQPIRAPSATTTAPRRTTTTTTGTLALASSAMARVSRLALQTREVGRSAMAASSASRKGFLASFTRGYSGYLSNNPRRGRLDFGRLENYENALYGLMGVNAVVFASWQVVSPTFMLKHFACSTEAIRNLRPHTLLTSMFSQFDFGHFAVNMLVSLGDLNSHPRRARADPSSPPTPSQGLYFWGRDIGQLLGGRRLLALYLAGGLAGTVVQVGLDYANQREYKWGQPRERYCLGASGAVNAIVTLNILLFRECPSLHLPSIAPLISSSSDSAF